MKLTTRLHCVFARTFLPLETHAARATFQIKRRGVSVVMTCAKLCDEFLSRRDDTGVRDGEDGRVERRRGDGERRERDCVVICG